MNLRINSGVWRGRRLLSPETRGIRPTSDRARAALFNILSHSPRCRVDDTPLPHGCDVVDVFAGTGSLGLEALSRGARHVSFIEFARPSLDLLRANVRALGADDRTTLLQRDALDPGPAPRPCHLALLDAPYGEGLSEPALSALAARGWLKPGALAVAEVALKDPFSVPPGFTLIEERVYGAARLLFLKFGVEERMAEQPRH